MSKETNWLIFNRMLKICVQFDGFTITECVMLLV